MSGLFITFEGGDGVGKSTQLELTVAWLREKGHDVIVTKEPGGTPLGEKIRELLLHGGERIGEIDARAEALLYAADRAQHVKTVIRPALANGKTVVQDRYIDSSVAYQGAGRVLGPTEITELNRWASVGLAPDRTYLLDLDPSDALQRINSRGQNRDRLESETAGFHEAVRAGFLERVRQEPERFLVLDARDPREKIQEQIRADLTRLV